jgi:hypothetical protein
MGVGFVYPMAESPSTSFSSKLKSANVKVKKFECSSLKMKALQVPDFFWFYKGILFPYLDKQKTPEEIPGFSIKYFRRLTTLLS